VDVVGVQGPESEQEAASKVGGGVGARARAAGEAEVVPSGRGAELVDLDIVHFERAVLQAVIDLIIALARSYVEALRAPADDSLSGHRFGDGSLLIRGLCADGSDLSLMVPAGLWREIPELHDQAPAPLPDVAQHITRMLSPAVVTRVLEVACDYMQENVARDAQNTLPR
jgi:hypothetical protein